MDKDFYFRYYALIEDSRAHAAFCNEAFGIDLCQHGFSDLAQMRLLVEAARVRAADAVLDLGCGNGRITEYLSDATGASFTGLDYVPEAVRKATERTAGKADRLRFMIGNINALALPRSAYSLVLSIDTIYFSDDYAKTVAALKESLAPGGRMAFLYSYGLEPWIKAEDFPKERLAPEATPLARALQANGLPFTTVDLTEADCAAAPGRKAILERLRRGFAEDGIGFVYENRIGEAKGITEACRLGLQRRYLYLAR